MLHVHILHLFILSVKVFTEKTLFQFHRIEINYAA